MAHRKNINWLDERARLMNKYASGLPHKTDEVTLRMAKPEYGWINMYFSLNGEEITFFEASSVYEPFDGIKMWLETIIDYGDKTAEVNIDCENYKVHLYYEPILYCEKEDYDNCETHPASCGIFSIYDGADEKITIDAFCNTLQFVDMFYNTILNYATEHGADPEYIENWSEDAYNHSYPDDDTPENWRQVFIDVVKSPLIEKMINQWKENILWNKQWCYEDEITARCKVMKRKKENLSKEELFSIINEIENENGGGNPYVSPFRPGLALIHKGKKD